MLASSPNTGHVWAQIEDGFATADAQRMAELDRLIAEGKGDKMRTCSQCGKEGHDRRSCGEGVKAAAEEAPTTSPPATSSRRSPRAHHWSPLEELSVHELLELRQRIDEQLVGRLARLEAERKELLKATAGAQQPLRAVP